MAGDSKEENAFYFNKCLEMCQLFKKKRSFNFSVTFGDEFKFTMNHSNDPSEDAKKETKRKKKYVSPSTKRRNTRRLEAFKAKKAARNIPSSEENSPLEPPGVGRSPPGLLPGEDNKTRDDPTNLEARRVDVPLVVEADIHPPPIPPPFQCDVCGQNFGKRAGLNGHLRKKHENIEQVDGAHELPKSPQEIARTCFLCMEICKDKKELKKHIDGHQKRL